jgi:hypothetical protein
MNLEEELNQILNQTKDTLIVMAEIQRRQAEVQKMQAEASPSTSRGCSTLKRLSPKPATS